MIIYRHLSTTIYHATNELPSHVTPNGSSGGFGINLKRKVAESTGKLCQKILVVLDQEKSKWFWKYRWIKSHRIFRITESLKSSKNQPTCLGRWHLVIKKRSLTRFSYLLVSFDQIFWLHATPRNILWRVSEIRRDNSLIQLDVLQFNSPEYNKSDVKCVQTHHRIFCGHVVTKVFFNVTIILN